MKLSDRDIKQYLISGKIKIEPPPELQKISGISIDLRLGHKFRKFSAHTTGCIDIDGNTNALNKTIAAVMSEEITLGKAKKFYLHPGELALASTIETITIPDNLVGWIDGRSSLARLGLMVHATAHRIDPGWIGQIVLEIYNCGMLPLGLSPNMCICALCFETLTSPSETPYNLRNNAKYKNQIGPTISQI